VSIKVQVIFYSMYGHVYRMAEAVVEGAKQVTGAEVSLYQVQELMPDDVLEKYSAKAAKASFAKFPSQKSNGFLKPTRLSSAPLRASAIWLPRCAIS
jgi:hypothetical protein